MTTAVIVIGRNEGDRLKACLTSLQGQGDRLIYVDSGSSDGSAETARALGATAITLDDSAPFTAARGRNAGAEGAENAVFLQFIDGDCRVEAGWVATARAALEANPDWGLVTGWRQEIHPEASPYNALCDLEWHRPAGEIPACGGDMMVRAEAFHEAGGFDPTVIAAEDDEFCQRLRARGWTLHRLPETMTHHDADMTRFGQWWQRAVRSGHGFAQVGHLHPGYFAPERRRVIFWGLVLPALAVLSLILWPWGLVVIAAVYAASFLRIRRNLASEGVFSAKTTTFAALLTLSKLPNALGFLLFYWRRARGSAMRLIEYK